MAGVCLLCNNLIGKQFALNDEVVDGCHCTKGKFDAKSGDNQSKVEGYFSRMKIIKPCKSIEEIQEKCDSWDDRLKPKVQ